MKTGTPVPQGPLGPVCSAGGFCASLGSREKEIIPSSSPIGRVGEYQGLSVLTGTWYHPFWVLDLYVFTYPLDVSSLLLSWNRPRTVCPAGILGASVISTLFHVSDGLVSEHILQTVTSAQCAQRTTPSSPHSTKRTHRCSQISFPLG